MAKNENLHKAKDAKKDEFYTQYEDIQNELNHYEQHFQGKTVLCNCDDPFESNFCKFFLRKLSGLEKIDLHLLQHLTRDWTAAYVL